MHLIKKIFTIVFFSMSIYSQDYYGKMVDLGKISEAGTDIIIYFEENTVRAYLRNYTNRYGNRYFDLFGRGSANDSFLELHSISSSEGDVSDGGVFKIQFENNKLVCDRLPFDLIKDDKESRIKMGEPRRKEDILVDAYYFEENEGRKVVLSEDLSLSLKMAEFYQLIRKQNSGMKGYENINNPVDVVVYLFNEILPKKVIKKEYKKIVKGNSQIKTDKVYSGYTFQTCADDYDIEEDYDGSCKTFHFYQNTKQNGGVELVEIEIHSTCLDDSCFHKYHQIRFLEHDEVGWQFLSHRSGLRCEELRGGGSPPCL